MRRRGEQGGSLILALVFIIFIGLLATVVLKMAFTGARTSRAFRQERVVRYNGESALNLAIQRLEYQTNRGLTPTPANTAFQAELGCGLSYTVNEAGTPSNQQVFVPGSILWVECGATPNLPSPGSGGLDTDGGQAARDVTIRVRCMGPTQVNRGKIQCNGNVPAAPSNRVLAVARVRFEPNYDPSVDPAKRAVVPKILAWDSNL